MEIPMYPDEDENDKNDKNDKNDRNHLFRYLGGEICRLQNLNNILLDDVQKQRDQIGRWRDALLIRSVDQGCPDITEILKEMNEVSK